MRQNDKRLSVSIFAKKITSFFLDNFVGLIFLNFNTILGPRCILCTSEVSTVNNTVDLQMKLKFLRKSHFPKPKKKCANLNPHVIGPLKNQFDLM